MCKSRGLLLSKSENSTADFTRKSFSLECGLISDCCEMEDSHRTILRDYWPNIVKDLEPNNILPDLGRVLTVNDDEEIKAQSTRQRRCEKLLEILPRKGPNAFKVFVEALKKEAPHLADDLMAAGNKEDRNQSSAFRNLGTKYQFSGVWKSRVSIQM